MNDVTGVEQLAMLSRQLRRTGQTELKRDLNRSLRQAGKRPIAQMRSNAATRLPRRGGLAAKVASSRITMRNRLSARNPTLSIRVVNEVNLWRLDRTAQWSHPVYGHRDKWVTQRHPLARGWATEAMQRSGPYVRHDLARAMQRIQRQYESG